MVSLFAGRAILGQFNQASTNDDLSAVETFPDITTGHREGPLFYQQIPPAGGIHNSAWQNCGIYDIPVANGNAVHSLEHGAVWITYRPDLPAEQVDQLKQLVRGRTHALLSPYPGLPSPIVASAWGVQLKVKSAADPRLQHFMTKYMQGPQTPEPNESCVNGIGKPLP